jgi:hypothetical protein
MVPELIPVCVPETICNQPALLVADQIMFPVPVLETLK